MSSLYIKKAKRRIEKMTTQTERLLPFFCFIVVSEERRRDFRRIGLKGEEVVMIADKENRAIIKKQVENRDTT